MSALSLHLPETRAIRRWSFAALATIATHAAIVAAIALWYSRVVPEPNILPAIAVSFEPASAPKLENDNRVEHEEVRETPPEPPKQEHVIEQQPVDKMMP